MSVSLRFSPELNRRLSHLAEQYLAWTEIKAGGVKHQVQQRNH